jgi:hypothetical protein
MNISDSADPTNEIVVETSVDLRSLSAHLEAHIEKLHLYSPDKVWNHEFNRRTHIFRAYDRNSIPPESFALFDSIYGPYLTERSLEPPSCLTKGEPAIILLRGQV